MGKVASLLPSIQKLYDSAGRDIEFAAVISSSDSRDDTVLAELIEADGRLRISRNKPVDLQRYFAAIADLDRRPDPLDAAIDVTLRWLAGSARAAPQAIESLIEQYPFLEGPIREAAALNAAIWSTTGLRARVAPPPSKPLPCEFGPLGPNGLRRYELQKLLGQGAFGQVYLTLDRQLSEEGHTALVAIKILVTADRSPWARQRMIEEATKVRRISHRNVVAVIDRGVSEQGEDFIVYEFVDGGDLSELIVQRPNLPVDQAATLVTQIALGVHAAHSAGVIHCDLKPGNIMMTAQGQPKVADFGIAVRLNDLDRRQPGPGEETQSGSGQHGPIGNLAFVSPEQYRGEEGALSVPSDIYALGGILYLLLTGKLPNGATLEEIAATHDPQNGRREAPRVRGERPQVDRDLESICLRAMAVSPADRYSSAAALAEDLERWLHAEPIAWTNPGLVRVLGLWMRRKPALAAALGLIIALVISGTAMIMHWASRAQQEAIRAAVTKVELDHEQKEKAQKLAIQTGVVNALTTLKSKDYRLNTELLTVIWALEYAFGPTVLGVPDAQSKLWLIRTDKLRSLIERAHEDGRGDELETLLWESALGFWLVCDRNYTEVEPLLEENLRKWTLRLAPGDDWMVNVKAMRDCAALNRIAALQPTAPATIDQLRELETTLIADNEAVARQHQGTPMHFLVLRSLADLYAPMLLNQPQRQDDLMRERQILIDETAFKRTGNVPQPPAASAPAPK